jgi:hypothetical protein
LNFNSLNKKRVVIVGGSHSGFSSAWILLNGPSSYKHIKIGTDYEMKKEENCDKCHLERNTFNDCICYGRVNDRNWSIDETEDLKNHQDIEIMILYRDHIRVYYPNEEEAASENYTNYNPREACNKQGRVYPFIGIRGDAKDLYNKILHNEESRVKLIHTQSNKEQINYINEADVIIWACGYITNNITFHDARNHTVEFTQDESGLLEVDKQLQLLNKNKVSIKNLYGLGQGYSTKTPEVINGKKARADSIHIYNTYIASKLYRSLEYLINKTSVENMSKMGTNLGMSMKRNSESMSDQKLNSHFNNVITPNLPILKTNASNKAQKKNFLLGAGRNIINTNIINKENEAKKLGERLHIHPNTTKNPSMGHKNPLISLGHGITRGSPQKNAKNLLMHTDQFKPRRLTKDAGFEKPDKIDKLDKGEKLEKGEKIISNLTFSKGVNKI